MNSSSPTQRCYDHRLKELVRTSGDLSVAVELGIPRSTAMGWLRELPQQIVTLDVLSVKDRELQYEVLMLRRRIRKLRALLRLLLVLLHISRFSLAQERVPEGQSKAALLSSSRRGAPGALGSVRWRVSSSALSVAEWVHSSTLADLSTSCFPSPLRTGQAVLPHPAPRGWPQSQRAKGQSG
jgi:hypothetical protein